MNQQQFDEATAEAAVRTSLAQSPRAPEEEPVASQKCFEYILTLKECPKPTT